MCMPRRVLNARRRFSVTLGFQFQLALSPISLPRMSGSPSRLGLVMKMVLVRVLKVMLVQAQVKVELVRARFLRAGSKRGRGVVGASSLALLPFWCLDAKGGEGSIRLSPGFAWVKSQAWFSRLASFMLVNLFMFVV